MMAGKFYPDRLLATNRRSFHLSFTLWLRAEQRGSPINVGHVWFGGRVNGIRTRVSGFAGQRLASRPSPDYWLRDEDSNLDCGVQSAVSYPLNDLGLTFAAKTQRFKTVRRDL